MKNTMAQTQVSTALLFTESDRPQLDLRTVLRVSSSPVRSIFFFFFTGNPLAFFTAFLNVWLGFLLTQRDDVASD